METPGINKVVLSYLISYLKATYCQICEVHKCSIELQLRLQFFDFRKNLPLVSAIYSTSTNWQIKSDMCLFD